jgi:Zn-dependent protease with chaperone function
MMAKWEPLNPKDRRVNTMARFNRGLLLACLLGGWLTACMSARAQLFERTDTQKEIELGREAGRELEREVPLTINKSLQERVNRIGQSLVQSMPAKAYPYSFKVLASPVINACCFPGGFIYVYEGLLERLPDDNAVAFILGHELTHGAHRHWANRTKKMQGITAAALLGSLLANNDQLISYVHSLINLSYTRESEDDADKGGLELYWAAGYDLDGVLQAVELIKKLDVGNSTPIYLRSHPTGEHRLKRMQEMSEALKKKPRPALSAAAKEDPGVTARSLLGNIPDVEAAANPWYPLNVGNTWTYAVSTGDGKSAYTVTIVGAIRMKGGSAYRAETLLGKNTSVAFQLFTTDQDIWRRNRPSDEKSAWVNDCKLNLKQGETAKFSDVTFSLEAAEPVNTPCGAFTDTLKVKKQVAGNTFYLWFARNVGLVKRTCVETGVTETLISYKLQDK